MLAAVQSRIVLDPYAHTVISRRQYGQLGADIQYGQPGVLGLARTWPQAAAAVPDVAPAFDWEGDRPLGLPMEQLVRGGGLREGEDGAAGERRGGLGDGEALHPLRGRRGSASTPSSPNIIGVSHQAYYEYSLWLSLSPARLSAKCTTKGGQRGSPPHVHTVHPQVIYEMHVRGFTQDDSSKVASPGVQG